MPSRHLQAGSTLIWLIIWLVGMAAIAYWCVARHVPALQQQITSNAQAAVTSANAGDIELSVDGRTATLAGIVSSDVQKEQLINVVADADGVRHVNDQLTLIGQASTDTNVIESDADGSDEAAAENKTSPETTDAATDVAAVENEKPSLDSAESEETADQPVEVAINEAEETPRVFEESVSATTEEITIERTSEDIQVAELVTDTELPTETDTNSTLSADDIDARAQALIEQAKRESVTLIDPETPRPANNLNTQQTTTSISDAQSTVRTELPTLKMQVNEGTLTLTGNISDQDSLDLFIRSAMSTFDTNYVVNSIQVADTIVAADWLPTLGQFLPEMSEIENAGVDIIESQVTLSGDAPDEEQHDQVIDSALLVLSELSLVERIRISEDIQTNTPATSTSADQSTNNSSAAADQASDTSNTSSDQTPESSSTSIAPDAESQRQALKNSFESLEIEKILFESGSDVLTNESLQVIESIATVFAQYPLVSIEIDGHTDASGVSANNLTLSQLRANAVRDYLLQQGIAAERMSAYGFGDGVPIADNSTAAGRRLNRRIEFNF